MVTADLGGMRPIPRDRVVQDLALLGAGALVPGAALTFLGHHSHNLGTNVHFIGVGVSAVMASAAALALTVVGVRRQDGRVVLVGSAFTVMAALLAIHGLATPGVVIGDNGVIALTGAATLPVGGAVLALSALPGLRRPQGIRSLLVLQVVALVGVIALGVVGMAVPSLVPAVPEPASPSAVIALGVGAFFYSLLILRALKTYLLTQRIADLAVVVGVAWLTAALPPALLLNYTDLGWWLGHGFELVGIVIVGTAVGIDLSRSAQSRPLVGDLRAAELVAKEEAFLGARVHALVQRLAEKDESTEEHTRRVAMRAVQVRRGARAPAGAIARACDRWASSRHREAVCAEPHPAKAGRAGGRRVRSHQAASRVGHQAPARTGWFQLLSAGARPQPPRAPRRQGLPPGASTQARSDSMPASLPSATSTTRSFRHGSIELHGATRLRSRCSETRAARPSTSAASLRSSASSGENTCSRLLRRFRSQPRPSSRRAPSARRSTAASS